MTWAVAIALSVALGAYNNILNRWPRFNGPLYVPLNFGFSVVVAAVAATMLDLTRTDIGLTGDLADLALGALGTIVFAALAFALARSQAGYRIADRRVTGLRGPRLAYQVLLRIPLGTAFTEELLFRGVLYAAWRTELSSLRAALISSAVFGLWHIGPTINLVVANEPKAGRATISRAVAGALVFTTLAGLALTEIRLGTHGLLAPMVLHAGINSMGTLAAVVAGRRSKAP